MSSELGLDQSSGPSQHGLGDPQDNTSVGSIPSHHTGLGTHLTRKSDQDWTIPTKVNTTICKIHNKKKCL